MNKTQISLPSWLCSKEVTKLFNWLEQYGEVRFVGGCVRDALLDKQSKDIDIASTVEPEELIKLAKKDGMLAKPTGIAYGTVTVIINRVPFEITCLRKDMDTDGRHAFVTYTTDWAEDAMRRDFTINAMSLDKDGNVYDYTTGLEDIKQPIVRFVGNADERIKEDYLRILRFFRFTAYYMNILPEFGISECESNKGGIDKLSGERVQQEMMKLCAAPNAFECLNAMFKTGILNLVLSQEVEGGNMNALKLLIKQEGAMNISPDPLARVAVLIQKVQPVIDRWKLSNKDAKRLRFYSTAPQIENEVAAKEYIRIRGNDIALQSFIVAAAKRGNQANASYVDLVKSWQAPDFPVTGKDLISNGVEAGATMGRILKDTEKFWVESGYKLSKAELLDYAKQQP